MDFRKSIIGCKYKNYLEEYAFFANRKINISKFPFSLKYFVSNSTVYQYDHFRQFPTHTYLLTMLWRTFHTINEDMAFASGLSLNLLLLFLIHKVKIKSMQKYNVLLLQCCCVDMFQIFISFIVKPVVIFHKRNEYFLSNGFLRPIGGWVEMLGITLWTISVFFCINSMPLSYIFRYRTLCLKKEVSKVFYVTSLFIALCSASSFGIIIWKYHYIDNGHLTYMAEEGFGWLMADDEGKVKAASACPGVSFSFIVIKYLC